MRAEFKKIDTNEESKINEYKIVAEMLKNPDSLLCKLCEANTVDRISGQSGH